MRTSVYIDGFNFFYWLKPTPYRWIDLHALAARALAHPQVTHEITAIKYFTARVSATLSDPYKDRRQETYLQALTAGIPGFKIPNTNIKIPQKWRQREEVAQIR